MSKQETVMVIAAPIKGHPHFHFCSTRLQGEDYWYRATGLNWVGQHITDVMLQEGVAAAVTNIEQVRECGDSVDYRVTYTPAEE